MHAASITQQPSRSRGLAETQPGIRLIDGLSLVTLVAKSNHTPSGFDHGANIAGTAGGLGPVTASTRPRPGFSKAMKAATSISPSKADGGPPVPTGNTGDARRTDRRLVGRLDGVPVGIGERMPRRERGLNGGARQRATPINPLPVGRNLNQDEAARSRRARAASEGRRPKLRSIPHQPSRSIERTVTRAARLMTGYLPAVPNANGNAQASHIWMIARKPPQSMTAKSCGGPPLIARVPQ